MVAFIKSSINKTFLKTHYYISFQDSVLSGANSCHISQVCTYIILVLLGVENKMLLDNCGIKLSLSVVEIGHMVQSGRRKQAQRDNFLTS